MDEPSPQDRKRRARAAWGYSLMEQAELADATGIKPRTLEGYLSQTRGAPTMGALYLIVKAAGIERAFADSGFVMSAEAPAGLEQRLRAMEKLLLEIKSGLSPP